MLEGKPYVPGKQVKALNFKLSPGQLQVSTEIMELVGGKHSNTISLIDLQGQHIKLTLTRLVGIENQGAVNVLPTRQLSLTQRVAQYSDPRYHFAAVVGDNAQQNSSIPIIPAQRVIPVVTA